MSSCSTGLFTAQPYSTNTNYFKIYSTYMLGFRQRTGGKRNDNGRYTKEVSNGCPLVRDIGLGVLLFVSNNHHPKQPANNTGGLR